MLIYEALQKDHDKLKETLNQLLLLSDEQEEQRHQLVEEIKNEWIPHARAEESVFYNSLRSIDSAREIVMHGFEEHIQAETLLRTLQVKDNAALDWRKTAQELQKVIEQHIQEEETKIFNVAKQLLTDEEAEMMAEAFEHLKPEVQRDGFIKNTMDMIVNLMPPRFAASLRTWSLKPDTQIKPHENHGNR